MKRIFTNSIATVIFMTLTAPLMGAPIPWSGAIDNEMTFGPNWGGGVTPTTASGDTAVFNGTNPNAPPLTISSGPFAVVGINYTAATPYIITATVVGAPPLNFVVIGDGVTGGVDNSIVGGAVNQVINIGAGSTFNLDLVFLAGSSADINSTGKVIYNIDSGVVGGSKLTFSSADAGAAKINIGSPTSNNQNLFFTGASDLQTATIDVHKGSVSVDTSISTSNAKAFLADSSNFVIHQNFALDQLTADASSTVGFNTNPSTLSVGDSSIGNVIAGTIAEFPGVPGTFRKQGSGDLTLTGTNTYTGGTTVSAGTLRVLPISLPVNSVVVDPAAVLAFDQGSGTFSGGITNNGTVSAATLESVTLSGNITDSGNIDVTAGATLKLGGTNSYLGGTTVDSGTIHFTTTGSATGNVALTTNATAIIEQNIVLDALTSDSSSTVGFISSSLTVGDATTGNVIAGPMIDILGGGQLIKQGSGDLTLQGTNTYSLGTAIAAGTLRVAPYSLGSGNVIINPLTNLVFDQDGGTFSGGITNNGDISVEGSFINVVLDGNISGSGNVSVGTNASLQYSGTNTYSGTTTLDGTLIAPTQSLPPTNPVALINATGSLVLTDTIPSSFNGNFQNDGLLAYFGDTDLTLTGTITGTGALQVAANAGGSLTLPNAFYGYTGGTQVTSGFLHVSPTNLPTNSVSVEFDGILVFDQGSGNFTGNIFNDGGDVQVQGNQTVTLSGNISGSSGDVTVGVGSDLTLAGLNTYSGFTNVGGTLHTTVQNLPPSNPQVVTTAPTAIVDFTTPGAETFNGSVSGPGSLHMSGAGNLTLAVNNFYTGGTVINSGTLTVDTNSLPAGSLVSVAGTLAFNQPFNGIFTGTITSPGPTGVILKQGSGKLTFNTPSPGFLGNTNIQQGELALNSLLGGNVTISAGAILSGIGTIGGNLAVNGTVSPGNSIGTLTVLGNYTQSATGIYIVEINGAGQSDLINVTGTAALGGSLVVVSLDGVVDATKTYTILHSDAGVTGTFATVTSPNPLVPITVTYGLNNVTLSYSGASPVTPIVTTPNEQEVLNQLISIDNPTPELQLILNELSLLASDPATVPLAQKALNQMSGEQYTSALALAEFSGQQFINLLYNPLRSILTTNPCCQPYCGCSPKIDAWIEAGGGIFKLNGNKNANGLKSHGYEITGGAQSTFSRNWTLGVAGSYSHDNIDYNLAGSGKQRSTFAAVYGLYRPDRWYILADAAWGQSQTSVHRSITIGSLKYNARGHSEVYQGTTYIEAGMNFDWNCILLQPFFALQGGYCWRNKIVESGAYPINLTIDKHGRINAQSRLGLHLTADPGLWKISLDLAWRFRMTSLKNHIRENFQSFGTPFTIVGVPYTRNGFDAAASVSRVLCNNLEIFAELSGTYWSQASSYNGLLGIKYSW